MIELQKTKSGKDEDKVVLSYNKFLSLPKGKAFAKGVNVDAIGGIYIAGINAKIKWVAVKEENTWCIRCDYAHKSFEEIEKCGRKLILTNNIQKLIKADDRTAQCYGR